MSQKSCFFFAKISKAIFFGGGEFSPTLKPTFERSLGPRPTFPFPGGVMENFAPRDGPAEHKV